STFAGTSDAQATVAAAGASGATGAMLSLTEMFCETADWFPHASTNVQVRTMVYDPAQAPGVVTSTPSTVMSSEQLSVAVNWMFAGISAAQVAVTAAGACGATGAVVS